VEEYSVGERIRSVSGLTWSTCYRCSEGWVARIQHRPSGRGKAGLALVIIMGLMEDRDDRTVFKQARERFPWISPRPSSSPALTAKLLRILETDQRSQK